MNSSMVDVKYLQNYFVKMCVNCNLSKKYIFPDKGILQRLNKSLWQLVWKFLIFQLIWKPTSNS